MSSAYPKAEAKKIAYVAKRSNPAVGSERNIALCLSGAVCDKMGNWTVLQSLKKSLTIMFTIFIYLPGKSGQAGCEEESDTLLSSWPETKRPGSELAQFWSYSRDGRTRCCAMEREGKETSDWWEGELGAIQTGMWTTMLHLRRFEIPRPKTKM